MDICLESLKSVNDITDSYLCFIGFNTLKRIFEVSIFNKLILGRHTLRTVASLCFHKLNLFRNNIKQERRLLPMLKKKA